MAISSNTLFHFTKEYRYLKQIIEQGLWPRYCVEKKWNGKDFAIPMLCFCYIPLSQVKEHIDEENGYGCYGIGVSKVFAKDYKITPVTYLFQNSFLMNKIYYFLSNFNTPSISRKEMPIEEFILYYIKKVSGYNSENEFCRKFYNEREWRYIPDISKNIHLEILPDDYIEKDIVNDYSKRTEALRLSLNPEDIVYIIVKEEGEIGKMIKLLQKKYAGNKKLEQLYSRIITVKQILEDF